MSDAKLDGRTALVTDGARGIGAAIVEPFIEEGARVAIADLLLEEAVALASWCGDKAVPYCRMGRPDDHVGAAIFLASADTDYVVAQTLNVDGGNWMS